MAVKFSELAKKLHLTKLGLQRKIKKLPFGSEVNIRTTMLPKKLADRIEKALKKKVKKKKKVKVKKEKIEEGMIVLPEVIKVKNFAAELKLPVTEVISCLLTWV